MGPLLNCLVYFVLFLFVATRLTHLITYLRFWRGNVSPRNDVKEPENRTPPTIPYSTPWLGDALVALLDLHKYVSGVFSRYGWRQPFRVRIGPRFLNLVSNPEHITAIFKAAKTAGAKPASSLFIRRVFGGSATLAKYWDDDNSGIALQPRKDSDVKSEYRVHFWTAHTSQTYLSAPHLQPLNERFIANIGKQLDTMGIQEQWVEYPDLYSFVQSVVGESATRTLFGPRVLELSQDLLDDFRTFDGNMTKFVFGRPRWLMPAAYRARDRIREALKLWQSEAHREAGAELHRLGPDDPEFDAHFGAKLMKARQVAMMKMGLDADDRASLDVGLMFAINSNVLRAIFWLIFHALRDVRLRSQLLTEVHQCRKADGLFDVAGLAQKPRLQSAFAEVCRYYVAIAVTRNVTAGGLKLGEWAIPAGDSVSVFGREAAFNDEAWKLVGHPQKTPLANFDAERFLVSLDGDAAAGADNITFSLEGLAGCWLPFGGGQRMCPGRHFAKSEMLGTFAMLFTRFELELLPTKNMGEVKPDMKWYPMGTLPPTKKVPFRIRAKTVTRIESP